MVAFQPHVHVGSELCFETQAEFGKLGTRGRKALELIKLYESGDLAAFWPAYAFNAFTVGLGELLACYILGSLLIRVLPRITFFRALIPEERLSRVAA